PANQQFVLDLSKSDGADQTVGVRHGGAAGRNGEPFGETGEVVQGDAAWNDQHGGPRDPQPGNGKAKGDVNVSAGTLPIWQMGPGPAPDGTVAATLTDADLQPIVAEAVDIWVRALGPNAARLAILNGITVDVGNLEDGLLGATIGDGIIIDSNAAGWGWFV